MLRGKKLPWDNVCCSMAAQMPHRGRDFEEGVKTPFLVGENMLGAILGDNLGEGTRGNREPAFGKRHLGVSQSSLGWHAVAYYTIDFLYIYILGRPRSGPKQLWVPPKLRGYLSKTTLSSPKTVRVFEFPGPMAMILFNELSGRGPIPKMSSPHNSFRWSERTPTYKLVVLENRYDRQFGHPSSLFVHFLEEDWIYYISGFGFSPNKHFAQVVAKNAKFSFLGVGGSRNWQWLSGMHYSPTLMVIFNFYRTCANCNLWNHTRADGHGYQPWPFKGSPKPQLNHHIRTPTFTVSRKAQPWICQRIREFFLVSARPSGRQQYQKSRRMAQNVPNDAW